jgi:hypothetical protein
MRASRSQTSAASSPLRTARYTSRFSSALDNCNSVTSYSVRVAVATSIVYPETTSRASPQFFKGSFPLLLSPHQGFLVSNLSWRNRDEHDSPNFGISGTELFGAFDGGCWRLHAHDSDSLASATPGLNPSDHFAAATLIADFAIFVSSLSVSSSSSSVACRSFASSLSPNSSA